MRNARVGRLRPEILSTAALMTSNYVSSLDARKNVAPVLTNGTANGKDGLTIRDRLKNTARAVNIGMRGGLWATNCSCVFEVYLPLGCLYITYTFLYIAAPNGCINTKATSYT